MFCDSARLSPLLEKATGIPKFNVVVHLFEYEVVFCLKDHCISQ